MTRPTRPVLAAQQGMTLIELMISMLLGLIIVSGILGIFVATSTTHRSTGDLARIQENARVSIQLMGRSMREASGNPCGLPPDKGLILHMPGEAPVNSWWSGGHDFRFALRGYDKGNGFPANGSVALMAGSDAFIAVSGNGFSKQVLTDSSFPSGAMTISSSEGFASGNILFACDPGKGRGVVFKARSVSGSGTSWRVERTAPFTDPAVMKVTALGKIGAEGWFVGKNARNGTSLFRAYNGDNGKPEEIATDVSGMAITYLLPNASAYVAANQIIDADWPKVIAAYIELTLTRNSAGGDITRTVGLTINLRNRFETAPPASGPSGP